MQVTRSSLDTARGPGEWFSGDVHLAVNEVDDEHPAARWGQHVSDGEDTTAPATENG